MDIPSLISSQDLDSIYPEKFDSLKQVLSQQLAAYDNAIYAPDASSMQNVIRQS